MKKIIILFITGYQKILSPMLPLQCRFYPSCSEYAKEAIAKKGLLGGIYYSMKRLSKCHPLHPGGVDQI